MTYIPEELKNRMDRSKLVLVTGHYGSGKTEFAVNLALAYADSGRKMSIIDIDIVNPYFRSREKKNLFEEKGIRVISSAQKLQNADIPALPGDIYAAFDDPDLFAIFDVGGDPVGARVLGRYSEMIMNVPYELLVVVNANRPQTRTPEAAAMYIRAIEDSSKVKATGIIDNTHLCGETTEEELAEGRELSAKVSELTGLPIVCHTAVRRLVSEDCPDDVFPIDIYMKKPWE